MTPADYHPVVVLPKEVVVLDLSGESSTRTDQIWTIGRYDEIRGIYNQPMFGGDRVVHLGIDIGGPVETPIHAFKDGKVFAVGINPDNGDYGPTLITEHNVNGRAIWVLHGHLSWTSIKHHNVGDKVKSGQEIAQIGGSEENGGWPPHLHFQLSYVPPKSHDMRGVFTIDEAKKARLIHPDPRMVLGNIY
jgi:murein DD-endopeptidase MepM/ murein hydrolase activator NlpD